jgi:hypothetical protein
VDHAIEVGELKDGQAQVRCVRKQRLLEAQSIMVGDHHATSVGIRIGNFEE